MFKLVGMKDGALTTVTWNKGRIAPFAAQLEVRQAILLHTRTRDKHTRTPFMQACEASLKDRLYCYWKLSEWLDTVDKIEGDTGVIEVPPGVIQ
jgi:hypothetical protein